jgi:protein involved in polysaccharide export with SLBB domain
MKIVKKVLFVLFIFLSCTNQLLAQQSLFETTDLSQTNIDDYSDNQLLAFYNKALDAGFSDNQIFKMVSERGMPQSEVSKLRSRLQLIKNGNIKPTEAEGLRNLSSSAIHPYDSSGLNKKEQNFEIDSSIFGSQLFSTNSVVFEPNLRIPAPAGYVLGPDDGLIISVYGYSEKNYNVTINESGEIYIPNVGPIYLNGLSLEEATEKIKNRFATTIYKAINTGRTKVQVTLGKIRSIRVTVIGEANKPGTYTVSSLSTLFNLLYLCGGPSIMGSYRSIEVIRGNKLKTTADLYDFLVYGNLKDNVLLQEGDVIRIPYYKKRVFLSGNVKRPGKFEMQNNETFSDLLKFSGGFTDDAYKGAVTVIRSTDKEKKIIDLNEDQYDSFITEGSDRYSVRKLQDEFGNRIFITGSVLRPGPYELTPDLTLDSLIKKAGGLTRDAYTKRISVFRVLPDKLPTIFSVNLDSLRLVNKKITLEKDDSVAIHSLFEFQDSNYVTIEGNVREPGKIVWRKNLSLKDLLLASGGISETGDSSNIEISRRIRNTELNKINHDETQVITIDLTSKNHTDVTLQPFDMVIVKKLPGYSTQRTVLILGAVKSPGKYALENSEDKISNIVTRAGGFIASADSNSISIRRRVKSNLTKEEKEALFQRILNINSDSLAQDPRLRDEVYKTYDLISVDLGHALSNPHSADNLTLEDGDILTVERSSNLVKVSGEVYFPTIVTYSPDKNLKYYVQQAGNFTNYARKSSSLVIYPDGKAASVKHFLWFKTYPKVTPRSEIFIPQKEKSNRPRLSIAEFALMVSSLGIIANVLKL